MVHFLLKKASYWFLKNQIPSGDSHDSQPKAERKLSKTLSKNLRNVKLLTGRSSDVVIREFSFGRNRSLHAALIYVDGMADIKVIDRSIIAPLMHKTNFPERGSGDLREVLRRIEDSVLSVSDVDETDSLSMMAQGFLYGDVALLIDGVAKALLISCKGWEKRSISEPSGESVIRGPRESFTENLRTNTSMIRRKIKNPALTLETITLGRKTRTSVCLLYIRGLADPELIELVRKRVNAVSIDSILESGYIEQYIEDSPYSIFATVRNTEKPDVVAANLLEGRVAIAVDGTPIVLTVPFLFIESFQTAEDYYTRPYFSSMLRLIRYLAYIVTVTAPAIYVAVTTYHQEFIPTDLLFTMMSAREGIPFPAFLESLIMLLTFEILREAGVRLPRPVGQAMSIVGALVIGEAAVSAGLIGAPMVIVIAITAVSIFVVPSQADAAAMLRIIYLVLAATMGGFGIAVGILGTLVHLASLESFGVPYLSPLAPFKLADSKDSLIRAPLYTMLSRPRGMAHNDKKRRDYTIPPAGKANPSDQSKQVGR